jgi:hypothetical protein
MHDAGLPSPNAAGQHVICEREACHDRGKRGLSSTTGKFVSVGAVVQHLHCNWRRKEKFCRIRKRDAF